jgi:streptogramin lyase
MLTLPRVGRPCNAASMFILLGLLLATVAVGADFLASYSATAYAQDNEPEIFFTEYLIPETDGSIGDITRGSDNNLWFTDTAGRIGRITSAGQIKMFPLPKGSNPWRMITGPDGNLWFTEIGAIGRFTLAGQVTIFPISIEADDIDPWDITQGPDGNLWFTMHDGNMIGRITTEGEVTMFPLPVEKSTPWGITQGSDGSVWFTEIGTHQIGRITPDGIITEFTPPNPYPWDIVGGLDGNIWFTQGPWYRIGRMTPDGTVTEFNLQKVYEGTYGVTNGPDGNLWFTGHASNPFIGFITPEGAVTQYYLPESISWPEEITSGPDGNIWFTANGGRSYEDNKIVRASRQVPTDIGMPTAGMPQMPVQLLLTGVGLGLLAAGIALMRRDSKHRGANNV